MEWIVNSLANVILETLNDMLYWSKNLVEGFALNIGIYDGAYGSGPVKSKFEELFTIKEFLQPIMVLAFFIVIACAILKLYQAMGGPFTQSEEPGVILIRTAFAGIGVGMSYSIFKSVEIAFNIIYLKFVTIYQTIGQQYGNADWNLILKRNDSAGSSASGATATQTQGTFTAGDIDLPQAGSNVFSVFGGDELIESIPAPTMGLIILEAIIGCTLLISFFKLVLEVYERYVLIGVMYITAPLAFSTLISKQSTIFKNWCQMLVCQFILMCMNLVFLGGFIAAWYALLAPLSAGQGYVFKTEQEYFATMFLLIGWLLAGQKMDEHLRSLGLSAATTGSGIMGAMMGGMALAATAFRMGSGVARSAGTNAHNAMTGQTKAQKAIQMGKEGKGGGLFGEIFGNNSQNRAANEAIAQQRDAYNADKMADYYAAQTEKAAFNEAIKDPMNQVPEHNKFESGANLEENARAAAKQADIGEMNGLGNTYNIGDATFQTMDSADGNYQIDVAMNGAAEKMLADHYGDKTKLHSAQGLVSLKDADGNSNMAVIAHKGSGISSAHKERTNPKPVGKKDKND